MSGLPASFNGVELTMLDAQSKASLQYQDPPAGSIFVAYRFSVRNTSTDSKFIGANNFTVAADGGAQGQIGIVVNQTWQPELAIDQLAPGNTLTGWVVFTVPKPSSCILVTCADGLLMTHSKSNGRSPAASSIKSSADPADQSSS